MCRLPWRPRSGFRFGAGEKGRRKGRRGPWLRRRLDPVAMVPSKCRPPAGSRPGHVAPANNYGLQLVLQSTPPAERAKPIEFRLHKDQPYLHNRFLQHDVEKNYSGKLGDGRLSPLSRNKKLYVPVTTNFADIPGLEMKYGAGSLSPFGDCSFPTPSKYKIQQGCHSASATIPENISYGNTAFPLVNRTAEEKTQHSDRLTLERQKLTVCPVIDGEEHLRLLSFQHNCITRIQNISNLQHLVFLDLYDNQIEEISGLSTLRALRVLLLGNNRIRRIANLDNLVSLDVLDLHGNQISVTENLNHLNNLRVLNLARNCLTYIENLYGLDSLTELNLRYNQIRSVKDVDTLPSLHRLFLSFNDISRFEDILCLADSTSLSEITLDGNPIAQETWYKPTILHHMMQLRQLDMKKITEEERRMASVALRKEEEKRRETHKQTLLKEKKRLTISNIARLWENQQNRFGVLSPDQEKDNDDDSCQKNRNAAYGFPEEARSLDSLLSKATQGLSVLDSHLVEIDGDILYLYGSGALESLDRNWSVQTAGSVATVSFIFIDFDEIVPVLPKLKIKFPNFVHLKFKETNLVMLQQFNALAQVRRLEQLTVDAQGNPIVTFTLWKYYVLFRLNHFSLQKINGIEVTQNDMIMAERLFGVLAYVASSDVPYCRLLSLLGDSRKKQCVIFWKQKGGIGNCERSGNDAENLEEKYRADTELHHESSRWRSWSNQSGSGKSKSERSPYLSWNLSFSGEYVTAYPSILSYMSLERKDRKNFCQTYIQELVKEATDINVKNESFQKLWPQMFIELVRDAVIEIRNKDSYMKLCLQRIMDQKS
ncbi:leucine-rich repeat-containing protein 49 [Sceloporus undulatus]|uniref:leucine-rich repeat-containing protein 49 n=1 Tax=Sceloporus undulatus TaxID=8520 RepID=UPI001C4D75F3|nr:leucine-rich repeat-containing protein 49 [Sceloporus undulatus]